MTWNNTLKMKFVIGEPKFHVCARSINVTIGTKLSEPKCLYQFFESNVLNKPDTGSFQGSFKFVSVQKKVHSERSQSG